MDTQQDNYDEWFTEEIHDIEKEAMSGSRSAVLRLVGAGREMRRASRQLAKRQEEYKDGWIEPMFFDEFKRAIQEAFDPEPK